MAHKAKSESPAASNTPSKPSPAGKSNPAQLACDLPGIIDELGALEEELAPQRAKLNRITELRKLIVAKCGLAPFESAAIHATQFTALIGMREMQRKITDIKKVFKIAGKERFLEACSLTLKEFENLVPAEQQAELVTSDRTGPRDVKTYRLPAGAQQQKVAA